MLFGRATKDDAYQTMPRVPRYEFEETRTRWALESTTAATADDRETRRAMRAATGLASASHEPYRPLGAVDVDRAMCEAPRREDPRPDPPPGTAAREPPSPRPRRRGRPVRPDHDPLPDDEPPPPRHRRRTPPRPTRASRDASARVAPVSPSFLLLPSLDASSAPSSSYVTLGVVKSPPPPKPRSPRVSASLRLRPSEATPRERRLRIDATRRGRESAGRLARLDREREDTYRRKRAALHEDDGPGARARSSRTSGDSAPSVDAWRRLRALETHAWYGRMLKMEGCAMGDTRGVPADVPGRFGGGAGGGLFRGFDRGDANAAETAAAAEARAAAERGDAFDARAFRTMRARRTSEDRRKAERVLRFLSIETRAEDEDEEAADDDERWKPRRNQDA